VRSAGLETGLRHRLRRLARQLREQHRHFRSLAEDLRRARAAGAAAELRRALARYGEALVAHFSLESEAFFPALHGLRPERIAELEGLEREHEALLAELRELEARLVEPGPARDAPPGLDAFLEALRSHERREEGLAGLLGELSEGPGGSP